MKKNLKYLVAIVLFCTVIFSCKKKDSSNNDPTTFPYTNETVVQGKANLQTAGQQVVTEMATLEKSDGINAISSFNSFASTSAPLKSASILAPLRGTNQLTNDQSFALLKAGLAESADTTLQQEFNRYLGIYTWNKTTQLWVKTASTDKIEFDFPSTKTGTTNNAKIVVTYAGIPGISIIANYHGDMPSKFNITLTVNDSKVAEYDLTASYNSDGTPASIVYFIALYPFKFEVSLTYNTTSASLKYSFTDNSKIIVECYAGVNGKLDKTTIQNAQTSGAKPEDIVNNANAYFQVLNIKLAGQVDYKTLAADLKTINANTKYTIAQADTARAAAYNKSMLLVLVYADSKQKIAQAEAYPTTRTYTYYVGNVAHTGLESSVDMRFIFADKSKGDLKTYFSTGFQNLVNDMNALITSINTDFGGNMQPIQYPPK
jgi:hypothetical protein